MAKLNFRLPETQARWGLWTSVLAGLTVVALTYFVFKGFNVQTMHIPFDSTSKGLGRFRPALVNVTAAVAVLLSLVAGGLGYNSLGEKRNSKQSWSWISMLAGALFAAAAVINLVAWSQLKLQVIK
ncbi:MAG: hypothetical protein HUU22_01890 [Phycisphaerae bacterium]|nr:hypothetical protein [Phycisphaerae bacterium]NUQ44765.1 hypothetical protein [Phycisphaerae bacterium]